MIDVNIKGVQYGIPAALLSMKQQGIRAIDFGRVREGDAALHSRPYQGDRLRFGRRWTVAMAESHTAEADSQYIKIAVSKFALLHFLSS